jgi:hypothetical protein
MPVTVTRVHSVPAIGDATPSNTRTRRIHLIVNGVSDATDNLTDSIAIDISTYLGPLGETPARLALRRISWSVTGFTSINLEFDRSTDSVVAQMAGNDYKDFPNYLWDVGTGGTGDLVFTTVGATAGGTFSLEIEAKLKF